MRRAEFDPPVQCGTWLQRATDQVIAVGNPRRAFMRWHFRRMEVDDEYRNGVLLGLRAAGYTAADTKRQNTPFGNLRGDADATIGAGRPVIVAKSRELNMNDPLASGLTQTFVLNVVSTGIQMRAATGDDDKDERLNAVWAERKDTLNPVDRQPYEEGQALLLRKVLEDGEVLRKAAKRNGADPVWFETVESDRLATPLDMLAKEMTGGIKDGVERDPKTSIPTYYWVLKVHPGAAHNVALNKAENFERVSAENIQHLRIVKRPGQTRALPAFATIVQDLRDLDLLMIASLKRAQIAACLAAFIKTPMDAETIFGETAHKYGYVIEQAIEPGMILKLYPEEEIQTLVPNFPFPELVPLIVMLARRIGAAMGVSWQIVLKDFGDCTYSSARTNILESRPMYEFLQKVLVRNVLAWEWVIVMEDARLRGDARLAGMTDAELRAVHNLPPGWDWVDPHKQATAVAMRLALGLSNLEIESGLWKGYDWRTVLKQALKEEKFAMDERAKLGLPPLESASTADRAMGLVKTMLAMKEETDGNDGNT